MKPLRGTIAVAVLGASLVSVGASGDVASAYCLGKGVGANLNYGWGRERPYPGTCDGKLDYYGWADDTLTDGHNVAVQYTHPTGWITMTPWTKKGNTSVSFGWSYYPYGSAQVDLVRDDGLQTAFVYFTGF